MEVLHELQHVHRTRLALLAALLLRGAAPVLWSAALLCASCLLQYQEAAVRLVHCSMVHYLHRTLMQQASISFLLRQPET